MSTASASSGCATRIDLSSMISRVSERAGRVGRAGSVTGRSYRGPAEAGPYVIHSPAPDGHNLGFMHILTVASEAVPFAKTGGLADVIGALPVALARLGHHVDVVIPRYRGVTAGERSGDVTVRLGGQVADAGIWIAEDRGPDLSAEARIAKAEGSAPQTQGRVRTIFIDQPPYFDREFLYGSAAQDYPDNPERFAFLALAALEWAASAS